MVQCNCDILRYDDYYAEVIIIRTQIMYHTMIWYHLIYEYLMLYDYMLLYHVLSCYIIVYGDHTNPPHPHKSDLNQSNKNNLQWTSSVVCVFSKFLHLINPNSNLLIRGGGGGVGLCGPRYTLRYYNLCEADRALACGATVTSLELLSSLLLWLLLVITIILISNISTTILLYCYYHS